MTIMTNYRLFCHYRHLFLYQYIQYYLFDCCGRSVYSTIKEFKYVNIANKRINDLKEGNLKIRPINKPIHKPKASDKIAQVPKEWQNSSLFK